MIKRDIIVIGASAGGVEALIALVNDLPPNLPAAVFAVLHFPSHSISTLPAILNRSRTLRAVHPVDGQAIEQGYIYLALPDYHLLVKPGYIKLERGPRENRHRPAIDPLFRTAAQSYGDQVIGVILSGTLDDGTAGLATVKRHGGMIIVQEPDDAMFPGMPLNAIANVEVDHVLPLAEIPQLLIRHTFPTPQAEQESLGVPRSKKKIDVIEDPTNKANDHLPDGKPSMFSCPECGGVLWEVDRDHLLHFRCRVGHAYTLQTLLADQDEAVEEAFWVALRALEERASLLRRIADRLALRNHHIMLSRYEEQIQHVEKHAEMIRSLLMEKPFAIETDLFTEGASGRDRAEYESPDAAVQT